MGIVLVILAALIGITAIINLVINVGMVSGTHLANKTTAKGDQVESNNALKDAAKAKLKKNAIILVIAVVLYIIGEFVVGY